MDIESIKQRLARQIEYNGIVSLEDQTTQGLIAELETLRAERDALLAALKPFAAVFDELPDQRRGRTVWAVNDAEITLDDLKQAHDLFAAHPAPQRETAWTPREGQDVRVIDRAHPMSNRVGVVVEDSSRVQVWVDFDYWVDDATDGENVYQLRLDQIAPAV